MLERHSTNTRPQLGELLPVYQKLKFTKKSLKEFLNYLREEYDETSARVKERITPAEFRNWVERIRNRPETLEVEWPGAPPQFRAVIDEALPGDNGDFLFITGQHEELLEAFNRPEITSFGQQLTDEQKKDYPVNKRSPEDRAKWLLVSRIMAEFIRRTGRLPTIDGREAASLAPSKLFETFLLNTVNEVCPGSGDAGWISMAKRSIKRISHSS